MLPQGELRITTFAAVISLSAIGCGEANPPMTDTAIKDRSIKQVGQIYVNFIRDNHKPPKNVADFKRYAQMAPGAYQAVSSGDVKVIWGVKLDDLTEEGTNDSAAEVLAYDKEAPTEGGNVLLKNRTVRRMTADEFKAAPQAAGSK